MNLLEIQNSITHLLDEKDYSIVCVRNNKNNIEVMIERKDGEGVTIRDCSIATKLIRNVLFDLLGDGFFLEVSSPGINRPLIKIEDYKRFSGSRVKIVLNEWQGKKNVSLVGKMLCETLCESSDANKSNCTSGDVENDENGKNGTNSKIKLLINDDINDDMKKEVMGELKGEVSDGGNSMIEIDIELNNVSKCELFPEESN